MLRTLPVLVAGLLAFSVGTIAPAQALDQGWWVIVGTFPNEPPERQQRDYETVRAAAARCHLDTFNDLSAKFRGFAPGFNVFVIGAFASLTAADRLAREARRCFPDAYVKYGEYLGE